MQRLLFNKSSNIINFQYSFLFTSSWHYSGIFLDIYKKIRYFTLFLLHLQFLHLVVQQQICDTISTVVIFSSGCHFGTSLPIFIFHPTLMGLVMLRFSRFLSITDYFVNKFVWCVLLNLFSKRVLIANLSFLLMIQ